jgi:hypothetical protein
MATRQTVTLTIDELTWGEQWSRYSRAANGVLYEHGVPIGTIQRIAEDAAETKYPGRDRSQLFLPRPIVVEYEPLG